MRVVAWVAGVAWFLTCTSLSYARFARHAAPMVVVQHGAVTPPLPEKAEPASAPAAAPVEKNETENPAWDHSLDAAPERVDVPAPPVAAPTPSAPALPAAPILPSAPKRLTATPLPAPAIATGTAPPTIHKPKAHKESASKTAEARTAEAQPGSGVVEPAARCLECGAPAASWVEVDGKRVGYCRKHYSKLDRPRAGRKRSKPQAQEMAVPADKGSAAASGELPTPAQQEAASVQCRGVTKDGTRCRRKTRDPSGFCYQHRPR